MSNIDSRKRLKRIWENMRQRCHNPKLKDYCNYGGRGIKICNEWKVFETFYEWATENGYNNNLCIDRKDNNGNYAPENCRWVTQKVNTRNKRNNVFITYNGKTKCASEWAESLNVNPSTIIRREKANKGMAYLANKKKQYRLLELRLNRLLKEIGGTEA